MCAASSRKVIFRNRPLKRSRQGETPPMLVSGFDLLQSVNSRPQSKQGHRTSDVSIGSGAVLSRGQVVLGCYSSMPELDSSPRMQAVI